LLKEPPWTIETLETSSPPVPFPDVKSPGSKPQILSGIKVLELCRIIAGPAIGRTLAEYGADVIKITSPNLSDVPFFQVDGYVNKYSSSRPFECLSVSAQSSLPIAGLPYCLQYRKHPCQFKSPFLNDVPALLNRSTRAAQSTFVPSITISFSIPHPNSPAISHPHAIHTHPNTPPETWANTP